MSESKLPLDGLRVIELTHAVMGPVAGLLFADFGAEVIRVEPSPNGDHTRRLKGFGAGYHTFLNRNKKSMAIDIKTEAGFDVISKLLETADILVENFGPGTLDRLGLGYDAVSKINPGLIYCSLKGFMAGPYEKRTALDEVVQMMSGLAYMTGPPGMPLRAGASIIDIMGGTYGAMGVLLALREREATGQGSLVRNGLFETAAFLMGQHMSSSAVVQKPVPPMPARVGAWAVYQLFQTKDSRQIFIGITSDKHWKRFCEVFERPDLFADEDFSSNNDRISARGKLLPALETQFIGMGLKDILSLCEEAGIPFSPLATPEDLFEDLHLNLGNHLADVMLPDGRSTKLPKIPITINDEKFDLRIQPPAIGEHTAELLLELGFSTNEIEELNQSEIIVA